MKADNLLMLAIAAILGSIFWSAFGPDSSSTLSTSSGTSALITNGDLASALRSGQPVLADFYADWCGPCRSVAPVVHEIANEVAGRAKVIKINIDQHQELAQQYQVRSIPTFIVFKDGKEVTRQSGAMPKGMIKAMLGL